MFTTRGSPLPRIPWSVATTSCRRGWLPCRCRGANQVHGVGIQPETTLSANPTAPFNHPRPDRFAGRIRVRFGRGLALRKRFRLVRDMPTRVPPCDQRPSPRTPGGPTPARSAASTPSSRAMSATVAAGTAPRFTASSRPRSGATWSTRLIGYARVSKTDGSQSLDLERDALGMAGVDAVNVYRDDRPWARQLPARPAEGRCTRRLEARSPPPELRSPGQHRAGSVGPRA